MTGGPVALSGNRSLGMERAAVGSDILLTKSEVFLIHILMYGICFAPGSSEPGDERLWLFDMVRPATLGRTLEGRHLFLISSAVTL